ncbi:MAG: HlyD family efflux transporter periplasmic adaptor subunit [Gemmatimonadota bacterium]
MSEPSQTAGGEHSARPQRERPGVAESLRGPSGMDVRREPKSRRPRNMWIAVGVLAALLITVFLARLEPAAPAIDRNTVVLGTVERGNMVRAVRGSGTLVPEKVQFVAALTAGRVESVHFEPGETVGADDILVVLSNPDEELNVLQAEQQWTAAKATLVSMQQNLGTQELSQEASVATIRAQYLEAKRQSDAFARLVESQGVSRDEYATALESTEALATQLRTSEQQLELLGRTTSEQIAVQRDQVARLRSIYDFRRARAASMQVRAGAAGVLQDFSLETGQWVQAGTTLARVAQADRLKAELRIPQTQARDVRVGLPAAIDMRTDTIAGRVRRVDPNVQNGSVLVEVTLEGELPAGARPDLSVDGIVELERLDDVLYVGRPAFGQSNSTVTVFLVDGSGAERTAVSLGRSSVNHIEILDGLVEGDEIILSDMSRYDDSDRVRLR